MRVVSMQSKAKKSITAKNVDMQKRFFLKIECS